MIGESLASSELPRLRPIAAIASPPPLQGRARQELLHEANDRGHKASLPRKPGRVLKSAISHRLPFACIHTSKKIGAI